MFLGGKPVLNMVYLWANFQPAKFFRSQSTAEIWTAIQNMSSLFYGGPPVYLSIDQGSNYISREIRSNVEAHGIRMKEAPIETPTSIGTVEIYHDPLRTAYMKLRSHFYRKTNHSDFLHMVIFSVN